MKDVQLENKKSSIDDFFKKASIEALATIYKYTKEIASFKWKKIIDQILNNKNIKTLFEHERLHEIFSDESEWGLRFKNSTTDYKDYTKFIIYLRDIVKNNQKHENVLIGYIKACEKEYGGEEVIFRDLDLDTILQDWYSYPVLRDYLNIDWSKIVRKKLSNNIDKAIILYKSPEYSGILSNSWGEVFAGLIQSNSDYKKIFDFIEEISKEPGDYETLIKDFINQSRDRGYRWEKVYKDRLSLGYISRIYTNKYLQEMNLDWVKMFSNSIKKWDEERNKVLKLLEVNPTHLESFCKKCAQYGYPVVEEEEIPWFVLANSKDYGFIHHALEEKHRLCHCFDKRRFPYNKIQLKLGKQILDFLEATNSPECFMMNKENLKLITDYESVRLKSFAMQALALSSIASFAFKQQFNDIVKEIMKDIENHIDKYRLVL